MAPDVQATAQKADELFTEEKWKEAHDLLTKAIEDGANDPELYYRVAEACRGLALKCPDDDLKTYQSYIEEGMKAAKDGLDINPNHGKCNCWYAVCLNYMAKVEGTDQRIKNSYIMKDHWMKALEANPKDETSLHSMGIWCYNVASLPWLKRKLAAVFFTKPPESSYEEALKYLLESEKLSTKRMASTMIHIAKCYYELKNKDEARTYCEKVLACHGNDQEASESRKEACELMEKL